MQYPDYTPIQLSYRKTLDKLRFYPTQTTIWQKSDFVNLSLVEPSLGTVNPTNLVQQNSSYYFLVANSSRSQYKSRSYTGSDSLFLKNKNLSYAHSNPTFNFDISGSLRAVSALFITLSTNYFTGNFGYFNKFDNVSINSPVTSTKDSIFQYLSAENMLVIHMSALSSVFNFYRVDSSLANNIFSSITWNLSVGETLSAYNIKALSSFYTPFLSAQKTNFYNLTSDECLVLNNLYVKNLSSAYLNGNTQVDPNYFYYDDANTLYTKSSSVYFFGVKPSDSRSTDDVNYIRTLDGLWDGSDGSIVEDLPVCKPYFRNIKQVFDYITYHNIYGEELNILIYDDINQDNTNIDGSYSSVGVNYSGNLYGYFVNDNDVPTFLKNAGFRSGNYFWSRDQRWYTNGAANSIIIGKVSFSEVNIVGMYEIGTKIFNNGKKYYSLQKPFNYSPRKISFRNYFCTVPSLYGRFGTSVDNWSGLQTNPSARTFMRSLVFAASKKTDVVIKNICFEYEGNANDSTLIEVQSGNVYLVNVTIAARGVNYYPHGVIFASNKSTVYVCGENQIDPYLLSPTTWGSWTTLPNNDSPAYFPGYGLAIVGNDSSKNYPTTLNSFFYVTDNSKIFIMDYHSNRNIGRYTLLNSSLILDGEFNSHQFYLFNRSSKIHSNNYIFKKDNLKITSYNADVYNNTGNLNSYYSTYFCNFNYVRFYGSYNIFEPNHYSLNTWTFNTSQTISSSPTDNNQINVYVGFYDPYYIFDETTKTINLSGYLNGQFIKNSLMPTPLLNDTYNIYNYVSPSDLPSYDSPGLYVLTSPIDNSSIYTLNYYSSGSQTIIPKK